MGLLGKALKLKDKIISSAVNSTAKDKVRSAKKKQKKKLNSKKEISIQSPKKSEKISPKTIIKSRDDKKGKR